MSLEVFGLESRLAPYVLAPYYLAAYLPPADYSYPPPAQNPASFFSPAPAPSPPQHEGATAGPTFVTLDARQLSDFFSLTYLSNPL